MKKYNRFIKSIISLVLLMGMVLPQFPAARADAAYETIDFSKEVLASRINQKVSGDCAVVSMATIEAYMHGATSAADKDTVYEAVVSANKGAAAYAYWYDVGYWAYDEVDWEAIYTQLAKGVPCIIHRPGSGSTYEHWAVVAGYNGSDTTLEWDKFIMVDVYRGGSLKDIMSSGEWGKGSVIDRMVFRRSGLDIHLHTYEATVVPPECTHDGYTLYECTECDHYYTSVGDEIPAGHDWAVTEVIPANCRHTEATLYACVNCQETKYEMEEEVYSDWLETCPEGIRQTAIETKSQYRSRERTGESWGEWSDWGDTKITATDTCQVETRTVYRYCTNLGAHTYSDSTDAFCNVCGEEREVALDTTPMHRLYNPNSGEHFYTGSEVERDNLVAAGWIYEGVAWNAPVKGGDPVHRVFNPNNGDHHYTMSQDEVDMLVSLGWQYEGVAWNSYKISKSIPQFRLYNPNADCGSHHYTSSEAERDYLVSIGWIYEGIGWYGIA